MVRVMELTFFREDVLANPLSDFCCRDKPSIRQPVFASEVDGREWSAIFSFSHAEHSSGLLDVVQRVRQPVIISGEDKWGEKAGSGKELSRQVLVASIEEESSSSLSQRRLHAQITHQTLSD